MTCVTRAREIPSRRAISAPERTSPASSCRCHSSARVSRASGARGSLDVGDARIRLLARAKSTTRHVAKFLFEADLGSREYGTIPSRRTAQSPLDRYLTADRGEQLDARRIEHPHLVFAREEGGDADIVKRGAADDPTRTELVRAHPSP